MKYHSIGGSDWPQLKAPSPGAVKRCTSCFFLFVICEKNQFDVAAISSIGEGALACGQ
jgi:hypothetical protein